MNTLDVVFGTIREHCKKADVSNEEFFIELQQLVKDRQVFLPLYLYLEVLQRLGLIIFSNHTKGIRLTRKGNISEHYPLDSVHTSALLFMYFLRRVFLFVLFGLMFLLLWPLFILVNMPYGAGRKKNSAG